MLSIIQNNAFRILGTSVNAKNKERLANISKIKAYSKINKELSFPLDLSSYLGKINRTQESLNNALSALNNPDDILKNSLFWFYTGTENQEKAKDFLINKELKNAREVYKEDSDFGSVISIATIAFINEKNDQAIQILYNVINKDQTREDFLSFIENSYNISVKRTREDLLSIVIDQLFDSLNPEKLTKILINIAKQNKAENDSIISYIMKKYGITIYEKIKNKIKDTEAIYTKKPVEGFKVCEGITDLCKKDLKLLMQSSEYMSPEYQETSNTIANYLIKATIAYLNYLPFLQYKDGKRAVQLLKKARELACSEVLKNRCEECINDLIGGLREEFDDEDY